MRLSCSGHQPAKGLVAVRRFTGRGVTARDLDQNEAAGGGAVGWRP